MRDGLPRPQLSASHVVRRGIVFGGFAGAVAAGIGAARWFNIGAETGAGSLSAPDAYAQALAGDILLVDIRRPDEWAATGVPEGAVTLDMRRADFVDALLAEAGGTSHPVALICARGVRSRRMAARLAEAGFSDAMDVPEGMLGSGAGPGWIARGLPVVR